MGQDTFGIAAGTAVISAKLQQLNETLTELGFNDYRELCAAIMQLKAKIATAKDAGEPCQEQQKLLDEYVALRTAIDNERAAKAKRKKEHEWTLFKIGMGILGGFIVLIIIAAIIFSH